MVPIVSARRIVSVLMPMRNAEPYVAAAAGSVLSQFPRGGDGGLDVELVIVDDGSTDGSVRVVAELAARDPRVTLLVPSGASPRRAGEADAPPAAGRPGMGISAALNMALSAATGELVARCDADDLYPPGRLARQADWLSRHPDFVAVCGRFSAIDPAGRPVTDFGEGPGRELTDDLRRGRTCTTLASFLIRTEALRRLGGFRTWFVTAEDIDCQCRLAGVGRVWYDPEPGSVYLYRLHDASITHRQPSPRRVFFEETARRFAEQRLAGGPDDLEAGRPSEPPADNPAGGPADARSAEGQIEEVLWGEAWREHTHGRRWRALRAGFRAMLSGPDRRRPWRWVRHVPGLASMLLKPPARPAAPDAAVEEVGDAGGGRLTSR
jgi:glycosyltransferase involved in cell wall biosynthesis